MEEKQLQLLDCGSIDEYKVSVPSRTYTYLLNDMGEEFKRKPILLNVFSEEYIPDEVEEPVEEELSTQEEKPKKKGFFASLFGKK